MLDFPLASCPLNMTTYLRQVLDGEYHMPRVSITWTNPPTVLDVGANFGAYTYWAHKMWPGCRVIGYEAIPSIAAEYGKNLLSCGVTPEVYIGAVFPDYGPVRFNQSVINDGMGSLSVGMAGPGSKKIDTQYIHPKDMPECDVLKLDIEGAENRVLRSYLITHVAPKLISFEFHHRDIRLEMEDMLRANYKLGSGKIIHPDLGTLNFYLERP